MSEKNFYQKKRKMKTNEIIAIQDLIFEYILLHGWKDHQDFVRNLSEYILRIKPEKEKELVKYIQKFNHSFFTFNGINKKIFLDNFPIKRVIKKVLDIQQICEDEDKISTITSKRTEKPHITFEQIFPEIKKISYEEAEKMIKQLENIPERKIQDGLRIALREKGATNITKRESESSLEIADLENFSFKINNIFYSFVAVVKGYKSLKHKHVRWEDIAHQILKAYQGSKPDYIILAITKDPVDGVITNLVVYGTTIGNKNLIILVDPINLVKFLHVYDLFDDC